MIFNLLNFTTNLIANNSDAKIQNLETGLIVLGVLCFIILAGLISFIIILENRNNKLTKSLEQYKNKKLAKENTPKTENSEDDGN